MPSSGGSVTVQWTASTAAVVNITGGSVNSFTVNGTPVTFPYTLSATTRFDTIFDGSYSVSVLLNGYEIASTPDGVRVVQLTFGNALAFNPTIDDQPDNNFAVSLSATYASLAKANTPSTEFDFWQYPTAVMASVQINSGVNRHMTARSPAGVDYAVWWDSRNRPIVGQWNALTRSWSTFDLSLAAGNPLRSPAPNDEHNSLSIAIDGDGYIHIWGNQHDNNLRYARSTSANDITAWVMPGMIGTQETQVTYPEAMRLANGNLLMTHRSGVSGNGDQYLNLYTTSTKTWSRIGQIFKGTTPVSPDESCYPDQIIQGADGTLHWFYMWRVDDTAASSHDLSYIKSLDNGVTWKTAGGTTMTLPIQPSDSGPVIVAGSATGLIASSTASVDSNNVPHVTKWTGSTGAWTLHHYYYSGGSWHDDTIISHADGGTRPAAWSSGTSTWAIYAKAGRLTSIRVAPTVGSEIDLAPVAVNQWEGTTDATYTAGYRTAFAPSGPTLLAGSWGGVLTLTPAMLDGTATTEVKAKPAPPAPGPNVPQVGPALVSGFYYTPPTGARASTTMQFTVTGDARGAIFTPGSSAHIASLAARLTTGGSGDSTYRLLLVEMTSPTAGVIRAASASQTGVTTGNIELTVENNAFVSNLTAGKQYVLAVHYLGGTTGPTFQSIPGSAWNEPSLGQATLAGALIPNVSYSGVTVTAVGGGVLSGAAVVGDAVGLAPTGTTPIVAVKVTDAP